MADNRSTNVDIVPTDQPDEAQHEAVHGRQMQAAAVAGQVGAGAEGGDTVSRWLTNWQTGISLVGGIAPVRKPADWFSCSGPFWPRFWAWVKVLALVATLIHVVDRVVFCIQVWAKGSCSSEDDACVDDGSDYRAALDNAYTILVFWFQGVILLVYCPLWWDSWTPTEAVEDAGVRAEEDDAAEGGAAGDAAGDAAANGNANRARNVNRALPVHVSWWYVAVSLLACIGLGVAIGILAFFVDARNRVGQRRLWAAITFTIPVWSMMLLQVAEAEYVVMLCDRAIKTDSNDAAALQNVSDADVIRARQALINLSNKWGWKWGLVFLTMILVTGGAALLAIDADDPPQVRLPQAMLVEFGIIMTTGLTWGRIGRKGDKLAAVYGATVGSSRLLGEMVSSPLRFRIGPFFVNPVWVSVVVVADIGMRIVTYALK